MVIVMYDEETKLYWVSDDTDYDPRIDISKVISKEERKRIEEKVMEKMRIEHPEWFE